MKLPFKPFLYGLLALSLPALGQTLNWTGAADGVSWNSPLNWSGGAVPGPAAYGRGGTQPTVTDASLALGYLDPEFFLGGSMTLDIEAARKAIDTHVAKPLSLSIEEAAAAMISVQRFKKR